MIPLQSWDHIASREICPGFRAKFIHSANMTFALWDIEPRAVLPEHSHPHEQVTQLLQGRFELIIDGVSSMLEPDAMIVIPPNVRHAGRALTPCRILDVFWPIREDYLSELNIPEMSV